MTGPGDPSIDPGLLQAPLDYPDLADSGEVLGPPAQARRPRPSGRRASPPRARPRAEPARTPEMAVGRDDLLVDFAVSPGDAVAVGSLVRFRARVQYRATGGALVDWPAGRIQVLFRRKTYDGSGPHTVTVDAVVIKSDELPVAKLRVALWSEPRKRWIGTDVATIAVTVYCDAAIGHLTADERLLACLIFAEGGEQPKVKPAELHAVAWSVRNRLALIERALHGGLGGGALEPRRRDEALRYLGKQATYLAVIAHPNAYGGYLDERYQRCADPQGKIENSDGCRQVHRCMQVAQDVLAGRIPDPYAAQGHPEFPGVFYYMTQQRYADLVRAGRMNFKTHALPAFSSGDRHRYWGLQSREPFEVR